MTRTQQIVISALGMLVSVWAGAYLTSLVPYGSWTQMPVVLTVSACLVAGYVGLVHAIVVRSDS